MFVFRRLCVCVYYLSSSPSTVQLCQRSQLGDGVNKIAFYDRNVRMKMLVKA